jgi:hypothetical protein
MAGERGRGEMKVGKITQLTTQEQANSSAYYNGFEVGRMTADTKLQSQLTALKAQLKKRDSEIHKLKCTRDVQFVDMDESYKIDNERLESENAALSKRVEELEDRLFTLGEMNHAPCFACGYNGEGYYQPDTHPCAEKHHRLALIKGGEGKE